MKQSENASRCAFGKPPGRPRLAAAIVFLVSLAAVAVASVQAQNAAAPAPSVSVDYATGFSVDDHGSYQLVTVTRPWPGAQHHFRYLLVRRGTPVPSGYGNVPVIRVPIRSVVALSSTFLAEIAELGRVSTIKGVESLSYVYNGAVREGIKAGRIKTIGEGASMNIEELIAMNPDLVLMSAYAGGEGDFATLEEAGLPVVVDGDWAEPTPLGRAEWIKFIALFYGEEAAATRLFGHVAAEYHRLAGLASHAGSRPTVFANAPWRGTWGMPGGRSYVARLLHDAGADYLWSNNRSSGTLFLDFEAVFDRAAKADYWIDPGSMHSLEELRRTDPRFTQFRAFKEGHVYNHIARITPDGGNDYWESGPANPQRVLADLIEIFHPDLLPGRKLYYYERLR